MGLFADKLSDRDIGLTIREWREEGTLDKNMRNLEDRIASGEKIGEVPEAHNGRGKKIKLKDFYTWVSAVVKSIEQEKTREARWNLELDEEIAKIDELLEKKDKDDDIFGDDDDDIFGDDDDDIFGDDDDDIFGDDDDDIFRNDDKEPTKEELKKRKEIFRELNPTKDKMQAQINKVEESIRKSGPDHEVKVSDGSRWKLKYLLQIAKEAYAEATEISSEDKTNVSDANKAKENGKTDDLEKELEKIKNLFEKGLIDESDYKAKKSKLLGL